jgi:hypothetical protein
LPFKLISIRFVDYITTTASSSNTDDENEKCLDGRLKIVALEDELASETSVISNRSKISTNGKLWMKLYDEQHNEHVHSFDSGIYDNCVDINLKPFSKIESNSNRIRIQLDTAKKNETNAYISNHVYFSFLLFFEIVKNTNTQEDALWSSPFLSSSSYNKIGCNKLAHEMTCETEYSLNSTTLKQFVCIDRSMLCNCYSLYSLDSEVSSTAESENADDNCARLIDNYDNFYLSLEQTSERICDFYLKLNTRCRNDFRLMGGENAKNNDEYTGSSQSQQSQQDNLRNEAVAAPYFVQTQYGVGNSGIGVDYCGNLSLSTEYGWIASPNFNKINRTLNYESGLSCSYLITTSPIQTVQIRLKYFYLSANIVDLRPQQQMQMYNKQLNKQAGAGVSSTLDQATDLIASGSTSSINSTLLNRFGANRPFSYKYLNYHSAPQLSIELPKRQPAFLGHMFDYDYINIYDGPTANSPMLAHLSAASNELSKLNYERVINSRFNSLLIVFHTATPKQQPQTPQQQQNAQSQLQSLLKSKSIQQQQQQSIPGNTMLGFNLTFQIKGLCIDDQVSCNSIYELNCYSRNQTCNDIWDCHNGADERGCGSCKPSQYRCRDQMFCYNLEDRCNGDHQCVDKSDEQNCDAWFCNSANGTYLCRNGRCIYEQWICDGTNDCEDGSDEDNCQSILTRRVITTAVLGGTLCCLLLVMALGCACKLYTLHTVGYRTNLRLSQSMHSAANTVALMNDAIMPSLAVAARGTESTSIGGSASSRTRSRRSTRSRPLNRSISAAASLYSSLATLIRRSSSSNSGTTNTATQDAANTSNATLSTQIATSNSNSSGPTVGINNNNASSGTSHIIAPVELPTPHHLIAPPTYNQTMGLVDEYEQRQLAFIEHVRSFLSQQQLSQQASSGGTNSSAASAGGLINLNSGNQLASMTIIPTVTSSTTTVHRVTISGNGRRSHSGRHHRHNHNLRTSSNSNYDLNNPNESVSTGTNSNTINASNLNGILVSTSVINGGTHRLNSSSRRHHHRHHHHHHRHNFGEQSASISGRHSAAANGNGTISSINQYDANRRGLQLVTDSNQRNIEHSNHQVNRSLTISSFAGLFNREPATIVAASTAANSINLSLSANSTQHLPQLLTSNNNTNSHQNQIEMSGVSLNNPTLNAPQTAPISVSNSSSQTPTNNSLNTLINKTTTTSINLRDRIAKLIKDIVVHHGDNIQYVQLAENANSVNSNSISNPTATDNSANRDNNTSLNLQPLNMQETSSSVANSNRTNIANLSNNRENEDDIPLIQP